ncbi:MAG: hypothetical protein GYA61_00070, partial [Spirochaetales bacterium]|nr:hypothetical protein [Spirochaetales bacterium]
MKKKLIIAFIILSALFLFSMQLCSLIFGNKPNVYISSPYNGQAINTTGITVSGTINDTDGDAYKVKVWISETSIYAWDYDVTSGQFSVELDLTTLQSGQYTICAQGYDTNNNTSDIVYVTINYTAGGGGANLLLNGDFLASEFNDADITYYDGYYVNTFLNNPNNGDFLPNWTFYIGSPEEDWPKIDIGIGYVRMYTTNSNSNGSEMGMQQDTEGISNLKTGTGLKIKIKFKIDSFAGGDCVSEYYEAPVKISISMNALDYLIAAFTNLYYSASGGYGKGNLFTGTIYTETFDMPT